MDLQTIVFILAVLGVASLGMPYVHHGGDNNYKRIVQGHDAELKQLPYQIRIAYDEPWDGYSCGGSLISMKWIVTAAHCLVKDAPATTYSIIAGDLYRSTIETTEQLRRSEEAFAHPNYVIDDSLTPFIRNDIGLIKVQEPFLLTDYVRTLCVPPSTYRAQGLAVVGGWGITGRDRPVAEALQIAELEIASYTSCLKDAEDEINENEICGGPDPKQETVCNGDSGGALAKDGILCGVVSRGHENCRSFTIFSEVANHSVWILGFAGPEVICPTP